MPASSLILCICLSSGSLSLQQPPLKSLPPLKLHHGFTPSHLCRQSSQYRNDRPCNAKFDLQIPLPRCTAVISTPRGWYASNLLPGACTHSSHLSGARQPAGTRVPPLPGRLPSTRCGRADVNHVCLLSQDTSCKLQHRRKRKPSAKSSHRIPSGLQPPPNLPGTTPSTGARLSLAESLFFN